jgi:membrane-associated phospholipid phosphatase
MEPILQFISWWGQSYWMVITVFVAASLFFAFAYKKEAVYVLAVFLADGFNVILKLIFNKDRPQDMDIFPSFQQGSFPSGHVVHYVVFFGFVLAVMISQCQIPKWVRWLIGALCVFLIIGVSFARVALGTHWVGDVLVAYAVGAGCLAVILRLYYTK